MYTIMVAAMGREVIAVDAMADNLAYVRRSLEIQNREHLVTLLHNAIRQVQMKLQFYITFSSSFFSNTHETLYPVPMNELNNHELNPGVVDEQELQSSLLKVRLDNQLTIIQYYENIYNTNLK